jgi:MurNAc alpha-1-phosphate uridylyltransferase
MVFAAGLGTRMRPHTDDRPKALVEVAGRTLVDHMLDRLAEAGTTRAVVNAYHFADRLVAHLETRTGRAPAITISPLLCGGRDEVIFTCNGDAIWTDSTALKRLAAAYDPATMDGLLLLAPLSRSLGFDGRGDFFLGPDGRLTRRGDADSAPYAYAGVQITRTGLFLGRAATKRSLNRTWFDEWSPRGGLFGLVLEGDWLHVGDPAARDAAEAHLAALNG